MERKKIVFLAEVAILAALILLMSFTPLGYLRLPGLSVSLLMIPWPSVQWWWARRPGPSWGVCSA